MNKLSLLFFLSVFTCIVTLSSCTKEVERWSDQVAETVYDTVSNLAQNRIVKYKVANTGRDSIFASIDNAQKKITVFLPYYYELGFLETQIEIPKGATILPDQDELVPVFSDEPFVYTVTDSKGNKAEYTVDIIVQQPHFALNEVSTETNTIVANNSNVRAFAGQNMLPSYDVTKMYLVDAEGKRVYELAPFTYNQSHRSYEMSYLWSNAMDNLQAGTDYWFEMQSYSLTVRMKYPVRINK